MWITLEYICLETFCAHVHKTKFSKKPNKNVLRTLLLLDCFGKFCGHVHKSTRSVSQLFGSPVFIMRKYIPHRRVLVICYTEYFHSILHT